MSTANPSRPTGRSFRLVCPLEQMPQVESLLRAQGYEFEPEPFSPFCRRLLCEPRPLGSSLAAFFGYIYIQDRSSMLPPLALAPRQGEAVLDMCASPGSKTGFLGQLTGPDGFVLGNELSRARLATLRANLHACNLPHVGTCSFEGQALPLTPGTWDAIQLDPPCSGWGTVEKNPQVLKLWQGDKLKGLVGLQQLLLAHAARLLRPGGRVVFSTCTTNDDENEAQVRFAEEELGLVREHLTPFEGFVWEERPGGEGTLRVDGERSAAQGFYVALLRKPADAPLPELPPLSAEPDARTAARNAARG
uniref:RsmB/NOP family class I SAM-dependent RNA methyltransferase n=2 Tax=Desulfovibrio TaxID=872 RepID=UPI0026ED717B